MAERFVQREGNRGVNAVDIDQVLVGTVVPQQPNNVGRGIDKAETAAVQRRAGAPYFPKLFCKFYQLFVLVPPGVTAPVERVGVAL